MTDNPHIGPSLDDWLKEEGVYEEATEEARRRVEAFKGETDLLILSARDSRAFVDELFNPGEPNEKLREAYREYGNKVISRDGNEREARGMRKGMQIYWVPTESVRLMDDNPPRRSREDLARFKDLLRRMDREGFDPYRPLLISKEGIIGDGNRRYLAARVLGLKEVPVIFTEKLYQELFEGNTGADAISNLDWLSAYVSGITPLEKMPRDVATQIKQCETAGGKALLKHMVEHKVSPRVADVGYRIGAYCEQREYPFIDKAIRWLIAFKNQDDMVKLMRGKGTGERVPPRVLRQAVEHELPLKTAYFADEESDDDTDD